MSDFFHLHAHSHFSSLDGMCHVEEMVGKAVEMNQPGLALTDHGNMSGAVQLYTHAKKAGIAPFPGEEFYLVQDKSAEDQKTQKRYHMGAVALNIDGYMGLVAMSTASQTQESFYRKPRIDWDDLQTLADNHGSDVVITTGCYFGILIQTLINHGEARAKGIIKWFAQRFPHTYVECQMHAINHEDEWTDAKITGALWSMANDVGVPVVITQDSHYCHLDQKDAHDTMKRMVIHSSDPDDKSIFPGSGFHLSTQTWIKQHFAEDATTQRVYNAAMASARDILNLNAMTFPPVDNFQAHIPDLAQKPTRALRKLCKASLEELGHGDTPRYVKRLEEELGVLEATGFSNYILLVARCVRWCHRQKIMIGVRGSGNGSLVCFLMGITKVDPIRWKVGFDRFLTEDRIKPPDIDIDIEDARRHEVVDYLSKRYTIAQIGNFNDMRMDKEGDRGSMWVQFISSKRRNLHPDVFKSVYGEINGAHDLPEEDQRLLQELNEIKVSKGPGRHAAGFVIDPPGQPISDYIPMMWMASSKSIATQFTMGDVEDLGYIKLDLLGLRTLTMVKRCLEEIGRDPGDGLDWIPFNDANTYRTLGNLEPHSGIFQFEGGSAAWGARKLKPRKIKDVIDAMALFRPAAMSAGQTDEFMARRRGKTYKSFHPFVEEAFKSTYGVCLYQEQVMALLRLLGMDVRTMNKFLSAVKSSNLKVAKAQALFKEQEEYFKHLCVLAGMSEAEAGKVWSMVEGFNEYGFNHAHATAYGILAYQTAYLLTHYPLEFIATHLETVSGDKKKEAPYIKAARDNGYLLLDPDVNTASDVWRIDRKSKHPAIIRGLSSIEGIGHKAAREIAVNAPFTDVQDLIDRTDNKMVTGGKQWEGQQTLIGTMAKLRQADALSPLGLSPLKDVS